LEETIVVRADILIRGGTIVDPARELLGQGDVLIRGDKIVESTPGEDVLAEESINATGCLVTPG
jgi:predicted amidohydrolase